MINTTLPVTKQTALEEAKKFYDKWTAAEIEYIKNPSIENRTKVWRAWIAMRKATNQTLKRGG